MSTIVSISSLKGGVGKTSVLLGLASAAQASGLRTLVIDLDPHGDASTGLGARSGSDIGTLLLGPQAPSLAEALTPSSWSALGSLGSATATGLEPGIWVARGSARSTLLESLPSAQTLPRLANLLEGEQEKFDLVLIDCPPTLGRLTEMAWAASSRVISVAEPSLFSVAGSERTLRAIARFEENSPYAVPAASIVINKVREGDPEHDYRSEEMRTLFGALVAPTLVPDSPLLQRIQGSAYPVHYWPEAEAQPLADSYTALLLGLLPHLAQADAEKKSQASPEEKAEAGTTDQPTSPAETSPAEAAEPTPSSGKKGKKGRGRQKKAG